MALPQHLSAWSSLLGSGWPEEAGPPPSKKAVNRALALGAVAGTKYALAWAMFCRPHGATSSQVKAACGQMQHVRARRSQRQGSVDFMYLPSPAGEGTYFLGPRDSHPGGPAARPAGLNSSNSKSGKSPANEEKIADRIRRHVLQRYIEPALARGDTQVSVKAGTVHTELSLRRNWANVCQAVSGAKFQKLAGVQPPKQTGAPRSPATIFTFDLSKIATKPDSETDRYWRMAMRVGSGGEEMWPRCRDLGVAAITYISVSITDLSNASMGEPKSAWADLAPSQKSSLRCLAYEMKGGDIIYVKQGALIVGKGVISSAPGMRAYIFDKTLSLIDHNRTPWPHQVPVVWDTDFAPREVQVGKAQRSAIEELTAADAEKIEAANVLQPGECKFWWVNQNQTLRQEIRGGYLWSPRSNKDGSFNQFYENMELVQPGDVVVSIADQEIGHVGVIVERATKAPKPPEFGTKGKSWASEGWLVRVDWKKLQAPLRPKYLIKELLPTLPDKYSPLRKDGDGLQNVYLAAIPQAMATILARRSKEISAFVQGNDGLSEFETDPTADRIEQEIRNDTTIDTTEKDAVIKARRGQGKFRRNLGRVEKACRFTGITNWKILRASHIKPWSKCATNYERLDGNNGLLLTPTFDALFDGGFLTFEDDGSVRLSPRLPVHVYTRLGLHVGLSTAPPFNEAQKRYLKFHRGEIFR